MTMTLNSQSLTTTDREVVFNRKRAERKAGIDQLIAAEHADGKVLDRMLATIDWDTNHAPLTTNLQQLAEIGVHPPTPESLTDEDLVSALALVINGLATLGVFLASTDHLDDRRLYSQLFTSVLIEEVRDIPPTDDMSEFIDLAFVSPSDEYEGAHVDRGHFPSVVDRDATLPNPKRSVGEDRPHS